MSRLISNVVKIAILIGCVYAYLNWESFKPQDDGIDDFARRACVDAINDRFSTSSVSVYAVEPRTSGYIIRASATLANGNPAKVYCLTNEHGGIEQTGIQER